MPSRIKFGSLLLLPVLITLLALLPDICGHTQPKTPPEHQVGTHHGSTLQALPVDLPDLSMQASRRITVKTLVVADHLERAIALPYTAREADPEIPIRPPPILVNETI